MFSLINFIVAMALCIIEIIYFIFILPNIPIKVKESDTLRRIKNTEKNFLRLVLVLGLLLLVLIFLALQGIAIGIHVIEIVAFLVTGALTISNRIEAKEKILKGNYSFTIAMEKVKDMTLKDSIIIVDEELRKSIILDDIEEIEDMHVLFKTGEKYVAGRSRETLMKIMSKLYQDKIIKANIKGVYLTELEEDKLELIIKTQSSNSFSTIIEKVDLPKWIK